MPDVAGTAEAQLGRILYILAAARGAGGIALDELAARLGVTPATVRNDVAEVTAREFYHPAASVLGMTILLERKRISVPVAGEFRRPMRLTPREAGALGLALRARAAEAASGYREELLELAEQLERALTGRGMRGHSRAASAFRAGAGFGGTSASSNKPGSGSGAGSERPGAGAEAGAFTFAGTGTGSRAKSQGPGRGLATAIRIEVGQGAEGGVRLLIERAVAARRPVRIRYLKPGDAAPADRAIQPYALVSAEGEWYVVAYSPEGRGMRLFRLDRVLEAEVLAGSFEVPADFDVGDYTRGGRPYRADQDVECTVRYSALVAPWVLEQGEAEPCADGSVRVCFRVADPRWLVRHVLQFAGEAVVEGPKEMRERVKEAALRVKGLGE